MKPDFNKMNGLLPVVIQNAVTNRVLMLGFMDEAAYEKTVSEKKVTFFSRTKNRLWTKGETSGNFLNVVEILPDCDNDTLLIKVLPNGNVCHTGSATCFGNPDAKGFTYELEAIISDRIENAKTDSYVSRLYQKGINKVAQKVGEEAVELVIEAKDDNRELFVNEAADLLFHYLLLLRAKGVSLIEVEEVLQSRNR
ncbi:MAG: bifunctional phosphoribosyl-AMP cyclohydrolase/phosphoribosyl-ATP diphosphatase HisIE [Flavobacterium sp.]|uniref:bifunctional phosphoribosyl-AMP cyclohydrolase/phosphoribosyl-ATP diphosphatase HisIE n=1 Tax=Flavobacterium sp. TaxID=239 RepID=UPI001214C27B|nr:bifunctional phosphoribosyl-AMP cyclohydrolase/phosphoribosyl-ATP diphosphatase HisIE [Flavobacterium sp.]RZJ66240.1 MAG: bifunctional phosphoribosyl-AMP cyclohydrolase/phosphoribosyl-ATP diphosphatase HisIE [Flavobacterium sp.]